MQAPFLDASANAASATAAPRPSARRRIVFAWELGGHTGHVTTLLPIARAMQAGGHDVSFVLRELKAGADLEGAEEIPRRAAPIWVGPTLHENPLNFGEILHNFGYQYPETMRKLADAWRERLRDAHLLIANVAPMAHVAARTLGIPSFEISQGFHIPPPAMPTPPLRDWEPAPRAQLEAADRRVVDSINSVLEAYGASRIETIGGLFAGRAMLLTYPELDIYPERGPADYYGIPFSGEGSAVPDWPRGRGARVFGYLYQYCPGFDALLGALEALDMPTLLFCRGMDPALKARHARGSVRVLDQPMAASRMLGQADLVLCHGSHQMTAQALLAGKPLLAIPTQLEQFLITRSVVRMGAGLGIAPGVPDPDFGAALAELAGDSKYARQARGFAERYAGHDRAAATGSMIARCEAALRAPA